MNSTSYVIKVLSYLGVFAAGVLLAAFTPSWYLITVAAILAAAWTLFYQVYMARRRELPEVRKAPPLDSRRYDKFTVDQQRAMPSPPAPKDEDTDHAIDMLDDTQASLMFNQTSDGVIELIHRTFSAHSTFFYLVQENELILQSYRSESDQFLTATRATLDRSEWFRKAVTTKEPFIVDIQEQGTEALFYYGALTDVRAVVLVPLIRKGEVLGILGLDQKYDNAFSEHHLEMLRQYARLIVQSIQSIDGVFVKNKLRKLAQITREFSERLGAIHTDQDIVQLLRSSVTQAFASDRFHFWMRTETEGELAVADSVGHGSQPPGTKWQDAGTLLERVIRKQKRLYVADITTVDWTSFNNEKDGHYLSSVLLLPVLDHRHCFGVLIFEAAERDAFDIYEVEFAETLANQAGLALARWNLTHHLAASVTSDLQTGMDNAERFMAALTLETRRAKRFGTSFSLLVFQVDYIKNIYETFGVLSGDGAVEAIAEVLKANVRQIDSLGRMRHDRFGLLLVESKKPSSMECAARILNAIEAVCLNFGDEEVPLTATIGIAVFGADGDAVETLLAAADQAVSNAKLMKERKIAFVD